MDHQDDEPTLYPSVTLEHSDGRTETLVDGPLGISGLIIAPPGAPDILRHRPAPTPAPVYPEPGSAIPDQPGYVVGTCEHRLAESEWRAGFRTCERCPSDA